MMAAERQGRRERGLARVVPGESTPRLGADNYHVPVLVEEVSDLIADGPDVVVDATLGGGGHAAAVLTSHPRSRVLGVDRDPEARAEAGRRLALFGDRARVVAGRFGELSAILERESAYLADSAIGAVLFDLGVSSHQLDAPDRGFSLRVDAPLDMRMDPTQGATAAEFLESVDEDTLVLLLRENGETRFARVLARAIMRSQPRTTRDLVAVVDRAVPPGARRRGPSAVRVFQALRRAVNEEGAELMDGLRQALTALRVDGALIVISYHSGEDRVVKDFIREGVTGGCTCPPGLPCVCGAVPTLRVRSLRAIQAGPAEVAANPRARSARLRVGWKVAA